MRRSELTFRSLRADLSLLILREYFESISPCETFSSVTFFQKNMDASLESSISKYIDSFSECFGNDAQSSRVRYLRFLVEQFSQTRNERVSDIRQSNMQEVLVILKRMLPVVPDAVYPCLCIDGRVLSETVFGLPVSAFRTPAADVPDVLPLRGGAEHQLVSGKFSREIQRRIDTHGQAWVILDSHMGCAAKGEEIKSSTGIPAPDGGLREDVQRKKLIAMAIHRAFPMEKVATIQTTFDAHEGFLFMGLEREAVLSDPRVASEGFTVPVLDVLAREGKILSTSLLLAEGGVLSDAIRIARRRVSIDFERGSYSSNMLSFWNAVADIFGDVADALSDGIQKVFSESKMEAEEIRLRSIFLISNAVLGTILNKDGEYWYGRHRESVIVLTDRARGPYSAAVSFPVSDVVSGGVGVSSYVIDFAASIIRGNRREGRFPIGEQDAIESIFGTDTEAFVSSSIPVFLSERISRSFLSEEASGLCRIDWESISWSDASTEELSQFIRRNIPGISDEIIDAVIRLRDRVRDLYSPGLAATKHLLSGQLALVPVLRSFDSGIAAVLPFVTNGYTKRSLAEISALSDKPRGNRKTRISSLVHS